MTASTDTRSRALVVAAAIVVLAVVSTFAIAAATGGLRHRHGGTSSCVVPNLPGTVVNVSLIDMSDMSGMGGMMNGGQSSWRTWRPGRMRVVASPGTAAAGTVSLQVTNTGVITHELVVLPLAAGQRIGARVVGADGKVDEAGSVGEVSSSCGASAGEGLTAGGTGWTTLTLPAGRYELVCNLPGHYAAGMYAELDVG